MLILYWIYKSRVNSAGQAPLMMRITINGERTSFSTNIFLQPSDWDQDKQKMKGRSPLALEINTALTNLTTAAWSAYNDFLKREIPPAPESIRDRITSKNKTYTTLMEAMSYQLSNMRARIGHDLTIGTLKKYLTLETKLQTWLKNSLNRTDIPLYDLNYKLIVEFDVFMRTTQSLKHNAVAKNMQQFKHIINECLKNDWIQKDPFQNYKCTIIETDRGYLTKAELDILEQTKLPSRRLEQVRDLFVFCCYTGLAYADLSKLSRYHFEIGEEGYEWINLNRTKTKSKSIIPLFPQAKEILNKYSYRTWGIGDRLLPVISNQNLNKYLKEIGKLCSITKRLSMHLARHTFATTVTLERGIDIASVSAMLGHKRLSTTQIYSKITHKKIAQDVQKLMSN